MQERQLHIFSITYTNVYGPVLSGATGDQMLEILLYPIYFLLVLAMLGIACAPILLLIAVYDAYIGLVV